MNFKLVIAFNSDSTLGRGDGLTGLVDTEIEHDPRTGLPFMKGRTLKGLLVEECANILYAIGLSGAKVLPDYEDAAMFLFGKAGSTLSDSGHLWVGPARFSENLREAVLEQIRAESLSASQVLESLTSIRRQTAVDAGSGAQEGHSLRAGRVLLHGTVLEADLTLSEEYFSSRVIELLAACVLGLRQAGTGRNRGRGHFSAVLNDEKYTLKYMEAFKQNLKAGKK